MVSQHKGRSQIQGIWEVLRIFWAKAEKLTEGQKRLHNEKLHNLRYYYGDQIMDDMNWTCSIHRMANEYKTSVWKYEGDHLENLGRDGRIILKWILKIGCESVNWIHLAQAGIQWWTLVNMVVNIQVPLKAMNFLPSWVTISFSKILLHELVYIQWANI